MRKIQRLTCGILCVLALSMPISALASEDMMTGRVDGQILAEDAYVAPDNTLLVQMSVPADQSAIMVRLEGLVLEAGSVTMNNNDGGTEILYGSDGFVMMLKPEFTTLGDVTFETTIVDGVTEVAVYAESAGEVISSLSYDIDPAFLPTPEPTQTPTPAPEAVEIVEPDVEPSGPIWLGVLIIATIIIGGGFFWRIMYAKYLKDNPIFGAEGAVTEKEENASWNKTEEDKEE